MGGTTRQTTKNSKLAKAAPIEETWQHILQEAIQAEASHIHLEPGTEGLVVRYRRHGLLSPPVRLERDLAKPLARYLKERAQLDLKQTRAPQSGNFSEHHNQHDYELSLSTMPLQAGERVVIRLHDPQAVSPSLTELGLWGQGLKQVQYALTQPHGLLLISGPNHSGVSTTLASLAAALAHPTHRIASVETEIAYHVPTIEYMGVRPSTGMTWQRVLDLQLKHEPTAVILGNMPDRATAKKALTAAQQQQLVISGMPVDTIVDSITQTERLSGDALALATALRLITNQRLVWHLCPVCRESYTPDAALQQLLNHTLGLDRASVMKRLHHLELETIQEGLSGSASNDPSSSERAVLRLWRAKPKGCPACHGSGYSGAVALFSVLPISDKLRSQIARQAPATLLHDVVRRESATSLHLDGCIKALRGLIAIESVLAL